MNELALKPRNPMIIKNLCPGLMEMGKIKIGNKGQIRKTAEGKEWQAPQKLDHFLITTMQRGKDNNFLLDESMHRMFGDAPRSIPVRLIYDDIALNFATRYICYYGKTVFCSGDGEVAMRRRKDGSYDQVACPCGRQDPKYTGDDSSLGPDCLGGKNNKGKCKINGILSVIIDGAQCVGGVWKFRTTSYNSVVGILSSLALIQRITGGRLAGIPMNMTITPKTVQDPIQGSQQTIYVVGLQYAGTIDTLRSTGYQIAMDEAKHGISMAQIEEDARLMLTHTPTGGLGDDPADDVIEEFYPEEAQPGAPELVAPELVAASPVTPELVAADVVETETPALVAPVAETEQPSEKQPVAQPSEKQPTAETKPAQEKPKSGRSRKQTAAPPAEEPPHPAESAEPEQAETPALAAPAEDGWPEPPGETEPAATPAATDGEMGDLF